MSNPLENVLRPTSASATTATGSQMDSTNAGGTDALFRMFGGTTKGSQLGSEMRLAGGQLLATPTAAPSAPRRTTVMLRNVPNDLGSLDLIAIINQEGFKGAYDFLFMPHERTPSSQPDIKTKGYVFINFLSEGLAHMFRKIFQGKPLTGRFLLKVGDVSDAKTQGFVDNMLPHQSRAPMGLHVFGCPEGTELVRGGRPIQLSLQEMIERNRAATEKAERESAIIDELVSKGEVETMFDLKPRLVSYEIMQKKQGGSTATPSPREGQQQSTYHMRADAPEFKPAGMTPTPRPIAPKASVMMQAPAAKAPQVRTPAPAPEIPKPQTSRTDAPPAAAAASTKQSTPDNGSPKMFLISDLVALKNLVTCANAEDQMSTEEIGRVLNQWQLVPIKADERDLGPGVPPESMATSDQFVSAIERTKAKAAAENGDALVGVLFCESLLRGVSAALIGSMRKVDVLMLQTGADAASQQRANQIIARNEPFMYPVRCRTVTSIASMIAHMSTMAVPKSSPAAAAPSNVAGKASGIQGAAAAPKAAARLEKQQQQVQGAQKQDQQQQGAVSGGAQLAPNTQHVARCFWHPTDPNQLRVDTGDVMVVKSVSADGLWAWALNLHTPVQQQPQQQQKPGWVPTSVFNSPRSQQAQPQQQATSVAAQGGRPRSAMSELAAKLEAQRGRMLPVTTRGGQQQQQQQQKGRGGQELMVVAASMRPGAPPVGTILQLDSVNPAAGTMAVSWNNGMESGVLPIDLTNYESLPHLKQGKHRGPQQHQRRYH
ncbi:hypothetical protein Pmar_PMAR023275 [Perkinsus marinus ATCC 50983]|uniref:Mei2-like C-terminal RNA recognition motif domain-containing protein n=1 Tax=Perkinsus marinus (strain ATCC 50983 / TXsc) TaxID=423536 RepID=C5KK39_PERM5|nr:hypothetical protein Pmar_PMAR023275 [Perkinsus marinus ATCC 50983]EER14951.1 hypothetical protein Pmar_PMAR023275 [Perkinsus marinus ATCC 50983]|eukprot:XP_002783155.1 hypothetical protein Pmar_PMAR023275 [Perkinsus marinus ATCC 50983]